MNGAMYYIKYLVVLNRVSSHLSTGEIRFARVSKERTHSLVVWAHTPWAPNKRCTGLEHNNAVVIVCKARNPVERISGRKRTAKKQSETRSARKRNIPLLDVIRYCPGMQPFWYVARALNSDEPIRKAIVLLRRRLRKLVWGLMTAKVDESRKGVCTGILPPGLKILTV